MVKAAEQRMSFHQNGMKVLSSLQACKTRAILTADQAVEIYRIKLFNQTASKSHSQSPRIVAREFGVSEKAVRDIWKGRTWLRETMHLNPAHAVMAARLRPPGRPRLKLHFDDLIGPTNHPCCTKKDLSNNEELCMFESSPSGDRSQPESAVIYDQGSDGTPAWWDQVRVTCPDEAHDPSVLPDAIPSDTSLANAAISSPLCCDEGVLWPGKEAEPLPMSSRGDDPFHDDWCYWPKQEEGQEVILGI